MDRKQILQLLNETHRTNSKEYAKRNMLREICWIQQGTFKILWYLANIPQILIKLWINQIKNLNVTTK